jgi:hypothetical protein
MTSKAFRAMAMALPEAHEEPHFQRTSFRVGKKIFATMTNDAREAMVRVAPREKLYALMKAHPDVFFSYGGWTERNGSLGILLAKADIELLKPLVLDSWRHIAPKRLMKIV